MDFFVTTEFMTELGLDLREQTAFAIIYSFSQDAEGCWYGSLKTLRKWLGNCSEPTAISTLKKLVDRGLIIKREIYENGVKMCQYSTSKKILGGYLKNLSGGTKISLDNIVDINISTQDKINKSVAHSFSKPTISEIQDYCESRNNGIDTARFFDYYEANGWKVGRSPMKDWKAAVRNWENRRKEERNQPQAQPEKESNFAYMMRLGEKMFGHNNKDDYAEEQ